MDQETSFSLIQFSILSREEIEQKMAGEKRRKRERKGRNQREKRIPTLFLRKKLFSIPNLSHLLISFSLPLSFLSLSSLLRSFYSIGIQRISSEERIVPREREEVGEWREWERETHFQSLVAFWAQFLFHSLGVFSLNHFLPLVRNQGREKEIAINSFLMIWKGRKNLRKNWERERGKEIGRENESVKRGMWLKESNKIHSVDEKEGMKRRDDFFPSIDFQWGKCSERSDLERSFDHFSLLFFPLYKCERIERERGREKISP